ncbi:MAG: hypothetical protein ACI8PZ_000870 [Myxococcota bacterium]|jgi:hypothetical protein
MNRIIVAVVALGACTTYVVDGDSPSSQEPGDLEFTWRVGTSDCSEAGLDRVALFLDGEEAAEFDCEDGFGAIERLDPGRYTARLVGRDTNGWGRYAADLGDVEVESSVATALPTAVLGALPGSIVVTWYFENARMCGANGVSDVEVTLFDDEYVVESQAVPCDSGILAFEGVRAGEYQLNVMGREADGRAVYNGTGGVQLDKGDRTDVEVALIGL